MGKKENSMQPAPTGNASNPSEKDPMQPAANQLIDERGEKYLRESAAPEDYPDVQDEEEAENQK